MAKQNNIRSERVRINCTQAELGEKLGVSVDTVRNWEDGVTQIRISQLIDMANLFSCSIDYLLDRTDDRILHGYKALAQ